MLRTQIPAAPPIFPLEIASFSSDRPQRLMDLRVDFDKPGDVCSSAEDAPPA
jgi:hypothetical protein